MSPHDRIVLIPHHCTGLSHLEKLLNVVRKLPVIGSLKKLLKVLSWLIVVAGILFTVGFLVFTFLVLPRLDHYRSNLESRLSTVVGRPVTIGQLSGAWDGLAPRFELRRLSIANPDGPALTLDQVAVKPSWISLLVFEPRLALIEVKGPTIDLKRARNGLFYVNGFTSSAGSGNGSIGNWLLQQRQISVLDARISWQDEYLNLPRLTLNQGEFELDSGLFGHTIKVSGRPPATVGDSVELSGHWRGDDTRDWVHWNGSISTALHGARVDAWRRYLQPVGLLRTGEGDGTLDLSFEGGHITSLLADVKVKNAAYTMEGGDLLACDPGRVPMLRISDRANVVLPYHRMLDGAEERARGAKGVGTTGRGIGPCYADKIARAGIRMGDLLDEVYLWERLDTVYPLKEKLVQSLGIKLEQDKASLLGTLLEYGNLFRPYITDTSVLINDAIKDGKKVMPDGTVKKGVAERLPGNETDKVVQFERFGFARIETTSPRLRAYFTQ